MFVLLHTFSTFVNKNTVYNKTTSEVKKLSDNVSSATFKIKEAMINGRGVWFLWVKLRINISEESGASVQLRKTYHLNKLIWR